MADKISTLALNVDLDCHPCYKNMRKSLCKFPEIESQKFDEEQKKVIISGPFEPEKLIKKLCCKVGCKIIKGYVIILKQPDPPPTKPGKPAPAPAPAKEPPSKPLPLVPGPVNIVIGPIGPVCSHRPFQLPDYSIPVDCNCKLRNPTCHCNGSRGNCQCGCGGHCNSHGSQGGCRGHSPPRGSQGNCQCRCGGRFPSCGSQGNCQCGCGGRFPSCGSQGSCQCGCGGQSDCRFLIEEEKGCTIM